MVARGFVSLVGAGPGDPDLLTVKALRRLQQADVVVFDRLVSAEILHLIPHGVSRISVGKAPGRHCVPQEQINEILVSLALSGRRVVRLKGGDPFIFGRGAEEALELRRHDIAFEVVPGITAAAGCSSYGGIPLTHRECSHGVRFLTGQLASGEDLKVDWRKIADPDCTLVIYMGLARLRSICGELIAAGLAPATPAAAIRGGTTRGQQKVVADLGSLADAVARAELRSPVTVIVGEVVRFGAMLDWFDGGLQSRPEDTAYENLGLARA